MSMTNLNRTFVVHALQKPSTLVSILIDLWGRLATCGRLVIGLLWGSQSWLQPAFSRLSSPRVTLVSAARDASPATVPLLVGTRLSSRPGLKPAYLLKRNSPAATFSSSETACINVSR